MTDLIFATPWWLLASLILVGAVLFWSGNNNQKKGTQAVGIALVVLAVLLKIAGYFYETDKEKVARQTNELMTSVQTRDWSKFASLLDSDVRLGTANGTLFPNRDALVKGAKADADTYALTNLSAHVTNIEQDALGITVDIDAWSEQSASMGMRVPSSWKLVWDKDGNEWRLHEVNCLRIGNENLNSIDHIIGK